MKDAHIAHLEQIISVLKQHNVPNTVRATGFDAMRGYVVYEPCGIACPPCTLTELLVALRDVLLALAALHAVGIVHRRICWGNVLKSKTADSWFLIGFDAATRSHGTTADMRGVGRLISHNRHRIEVPSELRELQQRMLSSDPEKRLWRHRRWSQWRACWRARLSPRNRLSRGDLFRHTVALRMLVAHSSPLPRNDATFKFPALGCASLSVACKCSSVRTGC